MILTQTKLKKYFKIALYLNYYQIGVNNLCESVYKIYN